MKLYYKTRFGKIFLADSLSIAKKINTPIDLIITSPPYALLKKKAYGNADQKYYIEWFMPFAKEFYRMLKPTGSFVLNIGSAYNKGYPTESLYQYELLLKLRDLGFHLAQECYWYKQAVLPSPAEWVTIRKIRLKNAIEHIFWLSKSHFPKASNQKVLIPYSKSMQDKLKNNNVNTGMRPSGHTVSQAFSKKHKGAIPSNVLMLSNTSSNDQYLRYCKKANIKPHPARFPEKIPEFFIRMLTDPYDKILDPFGGSCTVGAAAERLKRYWVCVDNKEEYLQGAVGRFLNG